jgi:FlaG/FlaF family flagellin (archaellin)
MPLTKYNNNSISSLTALPAAIPTGKLKLISSQTASNSASISFTSGLSSTYKVYKFVFSSIHPRTDNVQFQFNMSTDSGSNYNVTKTTTFFITGANEANTDAALEYNTAKDLAQSTSDAIINEALGNDADQNIVGYMFLFNPSSTTYVKHFISDTNNYKFNDYSHRAFSAGYGNTTSAVNAIRFQMSSGNFDGTIYLYAIDNS